MAAIATSARRVPLPRTWALRPFDIGALLVGNGLFIVAMWWRHGGLDQLSTPGGGLTAAGQLTALLGTYLALVQGVVVSDSPRLDRFFGADGRGEGPEDFRAPDGWHRSPHPRRGFPESGGSSAALSVRSRNRFQGRASYRDLPL